MERIDEVEPWIQWVSAHTGLTLAEHGIFRLGDIVSHELPQIWEQLEESGLRVGAISPMNAKHRLHKPAFFVPDPWTQTGLTAGRTLRGLRAATDFEYELQIAHANADLAPDVDTVFLPTRTKWKNPASSVSAMAASASGLVFPFQARTRRLMCGSGASPA